MANSLPEGLKINCKFEFKFCANFFFNFRGGATLSLLPEKDELVLFGGEYYDGQKVVTIFVIFTNYDIYNVLIYSLGLYV
jgi:hypothetical protein